MAWLTVPGTNIDGPVQQGPDNDYYLRRDSDGNEDFRGCYFADSDAIVSLANLSRNLVIYGHTFTDGWDGGFAQLDKYLDADWALEHTDIQVEIGGTVLTYEVCSVGFCNTEETSLPIYCNLDDEAYRYLIEDANDRNEVPGLQKLSSTDSILTLATCTENENIRLVVVAKQKYDTIGTSKEDES
ncbi:class B sortase [Gemmiger formicilis]|nr:class B sortase [Gemmiger formicilis]